MLRRYQLGASLLQKISEKSFTALYAHWYDSVMVGLTQISPEVRKSLDYGDFFAIFLSFFDLTRKDPRTPQEFPNPDLSLPLFHEICHFSKNKSNFYILWFELSLI